MFSSSLFSQKNAVRASRYAIALVYFWFGTLKLLGFSPAEPLVQDLFQHTLGWLMPFSVFYILFALFEMAIGVGILVKKFDRVMTYAIAGHLITTVLPLFVLPTTSWSGFLIPTLVGQYILKNVLIVSAVMTIRSADQQ
jgi:uncharacterized membrane protein YkgB